MNPYDPIHVDGSRSYSPASGEVEQMAIPNGETYGRTSSSRTTSISSAEEVSTGLVESDKDARRKLMDWNFDPDDVSASSRDWHSSQLFQSPSSNINYSSRESYPVIIFAQLGDIPMMRYILENSKNPTKEVTTTDEYELFPMYTAISKPHSEEQVLAMCKLLHANGADIQQYVGEEWTPLSRACILGYSKVAKWLLSSGALLNAKGQFDSNLAMMDLPPAYGQGQPRQVARQVHCQIFSWARQICNAHRNFMLFLVGTLPPKFGKDSRRVVQQHLVQGGHYSQKAAAFLLEGISDAKLASFLDMTTSPLRIHFNGQSGILEMIGDYAGVENNAKTLATARGLVEHEKWWNRCDTCGFCKHQSEN